MYVGRAGAMITLLFVDRIVHVSIVHVYIVNVFYLQSLVGDGTGRNWPEDNQMDSALNTTV